MFATQQCVDWGRDAGKSDFGRNDAERFDDLDSRPRGIDEFVGAH
jgi:hypothetical protein